MFERYDLRSWGGQMKVKYIAYLDDIDLTEGAMYKVLSVEKNWYRIFDDSDDDYLYPPDSFEIVEEQLCHKNIKSFCGEESSVLGINFKRYQF